MKILFKNLRSIVLSSFLTLSVILLCSATVKAEDFRDDVIEKALDQVTETLTPTEEVEEDKALKGRWGSNLKVSYGYDTNPKLIGLRKGDHYESIRYSLNYRKTLYKRNQIGFTLDLSESSYNEVTDLTNSLLHWRMDYKGAFSKKYIFGYGYDYSYTYYPLNKDTSSILIAH